MSLDDIRQYHAREERISEARMYIFRLVNRKPRVYQRINRQLSLQKVDLATISTINLERQVKALRAAAGSL